MADTTTAELLSQVFANLERCIPMDQGSQVSLFHAWMVALGSGVTRTDLEGKAIIGQVCSMMARLEHQIDASKKLNHAHRNSARKTLENFKGLLQFERFGERAVNFRPLCSETNRGSLSFIGLGLAQEFGEPKLEHVDAERLITELNDFKESLIVSSVAIDLKTYLLKYVEAMIWWLQRPEIASVQQLFEISATVLAISDENNRRFSQVDENVSIDSHNKAKNIFSSFAKLVGLGVKNVSNLNAVATDINNLIENTKSIF